MKHHENGTKALAFLVENDLLTSQQRQKVLGVERNETSGEIVEIPSRVLLRQLARNNQNYKDGFLGYQYSGESAVRSQMMIAGLMQQPMEELKKTELKVPSFAIDTPDTKDVEADSSSSSKKKKSPLEEVGKGLFGAVANGALNGLKNMVVDAVDELMNKGLAEMHCSGYPYLEYCLDRKCHCMARCFNKSDPLGLDCTDGSEESIHLLYRNRLLRAFIKEGDEIPKSPREIREEKETEEKNRLDRIKREEREREIAKEKDFETRLNGYRTDGSTNSQYLGPRIEDWDHSEYRKWQEEGSWESITFGFVLWDWRFYVRPILWHLAMYFVNHRLIVTLLKILLRIPSLKRFLEEKVGFLWVERDESCVEVAGEQNKKPRQLAPRSVRALAVCSFAIFKGIFLSTRVRIGSHVSSRLSWLLSSNEAYAAFGLFLVLQSGMFMWSLRSRGLLTDINFFMAYLVLAPFPVPFFCTFLWKVSETH